MTLDAELGADLLLAIDDEVTTDFGSLAVSMNGAVCRRSPFGDHELPNYYGLVASYVERRYHTRLDSELALRMLIAFNETPPWSKIGGFPAWPQAPKPSSDERPLLLQLDMRELGAPDDEFALVFLDGPDKAEIEFESPG